MSDLSLIKIGYSIHDVLDVIQDIRQEKRARHCGQRTHLLHLEDLDRLYTAGEHLARLMAELTAPEHSNV